MTKLLVTGGSGHLGQRVLELLLESVKASDVIATTRSPDKLARFGITARGSSFDDSVEDQAKAYAGAEHLLIISTDGMGRRIEQHSRAIEAAKRAGVTHVSYTSLTRAEPANPVAIAGEHIGTEQALAASGLAYTVLRNNWYAEYLVPGLQAAVQQGTLLSATANQPFGAITRDDCARAAAASLIQGGTARRTLEISGPEGVTFDQLAQLASELSGKPVKHVAVSGDDYEKAISAHIPAGYAHLIRTFHDAIAQGFLNPASDTAKLVGKAPARFAQFLTKEML